MYDKLSEERKRMQAEGVMPEWYSTGGWQLFKEKYLYRAANPKEQYMRIASTMAAHSPDFEYYKERFFEIIWKNWLSPSTPILGNSGTTRGLVVSCAGSDISDSINSIYKGKHEIAMLSKMGFGTASYIGNIRARGTPISVGGKAEGVMPVIHGFQHDMEYVNQGNARRGQWAGYLPIDHGDFYEVCSYLESNPDGNNIGWCISDDFIERLYNDDPDAQERYGKVMHTKLVTGKGYFFFTDKANRNRPQWYKDHGLEIKSPQLCNEIMLHSDEDHTYTCVLASMNAARYDEWKDTDAVFIATVFLDCVVQEFLNKASHIPGLEKAIAATVKGRALGLGVCGFHTYLQDHSIPYESFDAYIWNQELFKTIREEAERATKWLASEFGEPEWCKGYGRRNTHLIAVAPTKSTALIMGGISEGINPDKAMTYTQRTPAGEIDRVNPSLLRLMKKKGIYSKAHIAEIVENQGSVQNVDWLDDHEKSVFKNAFEIDQMTVLKMASDRAKYIDQWQSLNLFFAAGADESYINAVHEEAIADENILGLYYIYSKASFGASNDTSSVDDPNECVACQ